MSKVNRLGNKRKGFTSVVSKLGMHKGFAYVEYKLEIRRLELGLGIGLVLVLNLLFRVFHSMFSIPGFPITLANVV